MKEVAIIFITSTIVWPQVTNREGKQLHPSTENWIKGLLSISHSKYPLPATQEKTTHGHHQMVNTEIRLILFFAAKDGEALYSQPKQDQELTVAQIMNSLLPN